MWDWLSSIMNFGGGNDDWSMVNDGVYNGDTGGGASSDWSMMDDVDWSGITSGFYGGGGSDWSMVNDGIYNDGSYGMGELAFPSDYGSGAGSFNGDGIMGGYNMDVSGGNGILGSIFDKLKKGVGSDAGKSALKMGAGVLASYLGNKSTANANQDQAKSNLANYLSNVTWTPERSANYTNAVRANTSGILSGALAQGRGTLAEQLASAGRGGGSFGKQNASMTRDMLNKMASTTNSAIQTVNTPPNLSAQAFAIPADTSTGNTLTGISGLLGNSYNQDATSKLLQQILAGL